MIKSFAWTATAVGGGFVLAIFGYGAAGMIGGAIPTNAAWRPPAQGIEIFVETNGVHTGLIVPKVAAGIDWRGLARASDIADPRLAARTHLAIGWGERAFYIGTPTWADIRLSTTLHAATGSDDTLVHVEHIARPTPNPDQRVIILRPTEYRRLAAFIRASLNGARPAHVRGYARHDAFYTGAGRYDAVRTCNAWTGYALRHAGVRIGWWTPFPVTVMGWF
ncbi:MULTISPECIES: TIGR02117 family protein [unclassified Sphingomonas]|uniref:TIGR02117 family protein n=1 Tax=unclassified Sphingomonas TaxID=196159 RepID=UPI0026B92D7E